MHPSKLRRITDKEFFEIIKKGYNIVEFGAPWCQACKMIEGELEDLAKTWNDKIMFYQIDVSKYPGLSARFGVMSLPNILFFHNSKVVSQLIGSTSKKNLETEIKKILK
ncbi:MAG: thioredoxin domain-containing protein [Patescibacteria group bacterium]